MKKQDSSKKSRKKGTMYEKEQVILSNLKFEYVYLSIHKDERRVVLVKRLDTLHGCVHIHNRQNSKYHAWQMTYDKYDNNTEYDTGKVELAMASPATTRYSGKPKQIINYTTVIVHRKILITNILHD